MIDIAVSQAIINGAQIDCEKDIRTYLTPKAEINLSPRGITLSLGINFARKKTKTYRMKDKN